ncbi:MAG: hypothetical protein ACFCU5_06670 [Pleurocapsa sp.]
MKYVDLQTRLKQYHQAGLVTIQLNSPKSILENEYRRCLQLGLSQSELETQADVFRAKQLDLISAWDIYTFPEKFLLKTIKAKTYQLAEVNNLRDLKQAFPLVKDKQYDFRTKKSWSECIYLIDSLTKDSQEFKQFKREVQSFINAIEQQQYHQLTGELAVTEAYDDLSNYVSWWKGAQWEYTLSCQPKTIDLLKRAWLEQYLSQHKLEKLLKYTPMD